MTHIKVFGFHLRHRLYLFILSFAISSINECICDLSNNNDSTSIKQQHTYYSVKLGDTLVIPCEITNRKQATVIWQYSKSRIPETLTVGYFYYRKDFRIRLITNSTSDSEETWNLEIRKVKLEDEGYYLCKVMATPNSLKRVVYLKVDVDLRMQVLNPIFNTGDRVVLNCNTSLAISKKARSKTSSATNAQHHHPKLVWYKDGQHLLTNNELNQLNDTTKIDYKIESSSSPYLWSKLVFYSFDSTNVGTYTCKFRNQNVSQVLNPYQANNKRIFELFNNSNKSTLGPNNLEICLIAVLFHVFKFF